MPKEPKYRPRSREEITKDSNANFTAVKYLQLEVLLDIRDILNARLPAY